MNLEALKSAVNKIHLASEQLRIEIHAAETEMPAWLEFHFARLRLIRHWAAIGKSSEEISRDISTAPGVVASLAMDPDATDEPAS